MAEPMECDTGNTISDRGFIGIGSNGLVYVSDGFGSVGVFDENGNVLGFTQGIDGQSYNSAEGIAIGNGIWYLADNGAEEVYELNQNCPWMMSPTLTFTPTATDTPMATATDTPTTVPFSCGQMTDWGATEPYGIAVDSQNNVYAAVQYAVAFSNPQGGLISYVGDNILSAPMGVALDINGNIYVTDQNNNQVYVFNSLKAPTNPGSLLTQWGQTESGQVEQPTGIAVNSACQLVYVADSNNQSLDVFKENGSPVTQLGGIGTGLFYFPFGVAVDGTGNIYVTDADTSLVQVFNPQLQPVNQWNTTQDTPLMGAGFISSGPDGLLYVSDGWGEIGIFNNLGNFIGATNGEMDDGNIFFQDVEGVAIGNNAWYASNFGQSLIENFSVCSLGGSI